MRSPLAALRGTLEIQLTQPEQAAWPAVAHRPSLVRGGSSRRSPSQGCCISSPGTGTACCTGRWSGPGNRPRTDPHPVPPTFEPPPSRRGQRGRAARHRAAGLRTSWVRSYRNDSRESISKYAVRFNAGEMRKAPP
ncbi:hypothetical protein [Actinomadura coerulea]|uniref:hypothetical protein n=1 Tax=Actinomadura coerulea TaxID=46159 RepID=UPI001E43B122